MGQEEVKKELIKSGKKTVTPIQIAAMVRKAEKKVLSQTQSQGPGIVAGPVSKESARRLMTYGVEP